MTHVDRPGAARVQVARIGGVSRVVRARASAPLRILTPRGGGPAAWVVSSSFGGGFVDGDSLELDFEIGASASALFTTQASSKVYRGVSSQITRAVVAEDATLLVLPDPTAPFASSNFRQSTHVTLTATSSLALVDTLTAGRIAHGERWSFARLSSSLSLDIDGRPVLRDAIILDPIAGSISERLGRFQAVSTIVLVGPLFRDISRTHLASIAATRIARRAEVFVSASALADGVILRLAATTSAGAIETSRSLLAPACALAGEDPWSRKW